MLSEFKSRVSKWKFVVALSGQHTSERCTSPFRLVNVYHHHIHIHTRYAIALIGEFLDALHCRYLMRDLEIFM